MKNKSEFRISFANQRLYLHLKITDEEFPRLLVTRKIEGDAQNLQALQSLR